MNNKLTKILSGVMLGSLALAPIMTTSCGNQSKVKKNPHIISISDIHGEIPGYGDDFFTSRKTYAGAIRMADAMQEVVENASDSVILSGGDQNSSGPFSSSVQGKTMYPVLKAMDIRYSAVGNHAWDWGDQNLKDEVYDKLGRTDKTEGKYFVASNILTVRGQSDRTWELDENETVKFENDYSLWKSTLPKWVDPYKIVNLDNHKVCLIGLTTKTTLEDGNKKYTDNLSFINYNAAVHYTKHLIKTEQPSLFDQIESFILLTHIGGITENGFIRGDVGKLATEIDTPVDAILAGHTHTDICGKIYNNKIDRPIAIVETKDKMQSFADLELEFDDNKPIGQRFKKITPKIITPKIDSSSIAAAKKQIDDIEAKPRNEVVKNTCEEYEKQKIIAKEKLQTKIGESQEMDYLQSTRNNLYDYKYPLDYTDVEGKDSSLVEQAGAFAAKSEIAGFNLMWNKMEPTKQAKQNRANISYISNTSIHDGFTEGDVTMKSIYGLFPYDEYTCTITLTFYQLKQIIHYMFGGAKLSKDDRIHNVLCDEQYKATPTSEPYYPLRHRYPYGPNQFYGFAFNVVTAKSTDPQYRRFVEKTTSTTGDPDPMDLKIYDPTQPECNIDDPSTWIPNNSEKYGNNYWWDEAEEKPVKYITMVISSFDLFETNRQNLMIPYFANYNQSTLEELYGIKQYQEKDVRDLCLDYVIDENAKGNTIEMPENVCKQLTNLWS